MISVARIIAASAVVGALVASAPAMLIDDFTEGIDTLHVHSATGSIEGQQNGTNIAGEQRDVWLQATANPYNQYITFDITGNPDLGASFYNGDTGTRGFVQLDYDSFDAEGNNGGQSSGVGMNLDITGDDGFVFHFLEADGPIAISVMAQTYGAPTQTSVGTFTTSGAMSGPTDFTIEFNSLSLGSGSTEQFDRSDVDRLVFRFTPVNPSADFALGSITTEPAPEPASLAILGAGFAGLMRLRRRRRS